MADPAFYNRDGHPVYLVPDGATARLVYVVVTPQGTFYADAQGHASRPDRSAGTGTGALLGGLIGLLFGPAGAVIGAGVGALLGNAADENADRRRGDG